MAAVAPAQVCRPFAAATCRAISASAGRGSRVVLRISAQQASTDPVRAATEAIRKTELPAFLKPAALTAVANVLLTLPAHAEAGKIFDFNLTLPVMVGQFLLLMVFLDKTWFGPVGRQLDERDALIRSKLASVKDNSGELQRLQEEAEKVLADARSQAQKLISETRSQTQAEQAKKLAALKEKIDKELETALAALQKEEEDALNNLDSQVEKLADEIMARLVPEGVKG